MHLASSPMLPQASTGVARLSMHEPSQATGKRAVVSSIIEASSQISGVPASSGVGPPTQENANPTLHASPTIGPGGSPVSVVSVLVSVVVSIVSLDVVSIVVLDVVSSVSLDEVPRFPDLAARVPVGGCVAPMPGKIILVRVAAGEKVAAGQTLLVMEAMKMEHAVTASAAGVVAELYVAAGDQVEADTLLALVTPEEAAQ